MNVDDTTIRWIDLDGTLNTRALGPLPADGGELRADRVIRSDSLTRLTPADVRTLTGDWGVRTVIDLRSALEVAEDGGNPMRDAGADVRECPLIDARKFTTMPEGLDRLGSDYGPLLRIGAEGIIAALELMADPARLPVVVHCTAGKDRTGVVTAVLLDTLGVPRDTILDEYYATARRLSEVVKRAQSLPSIRDNPVPPGAVTLSKEAVNGAFRELDAAGGPHAWLTTNGAAPDLPGRLRTALLTVD